MTGAPVWRLIRRICRMSTAWRSERQGRCQISCTWLVECWWGKHIYSSTWWQGRKYPTKIPSTSVKLCHFLTVSHSWAKSFASCTWTKRLVAAPSSWMGAKAPCPGTTHERCLSFGWTQEHLPSGHVPPSFDKSSQKRIRTTMDHTQMSRFRLYQENERSENSHFGGLPSWDYGIKGGDGPFRPQALAIAWPSSQDLWQSIGVIAISQEVNRRLIVCNFQCLDILATNLQEDTGSILTEILASHQHQRWRRSVWNLVRYNCSRYLRRSLELWSSSQKNLKKSGLCQASKWISERQRSRALMEKSSSKSRGRSPGCSAEPHLQPNTWST